jgi:hypothetical protein
VFIKRFYISMLWYLSYTRNGGSAKRSCGFPTLQALSLLYLIIYWAVSYIYGLSSYLCIHNYHTQVMGGPQNGLAVFPHYKCIVMFSLVIYKAVSHIYALTGFGKVVLRFSPITSVYLWYSLIFLKQFHTSMLWYLSYTSNGGSAKWSGGFSPLQVFTIVIPC